MKIVAVVGSLRKESYNLFLAKEAKRMAEARGVSFEILDYGDVPFFDEDTEKIGSAPVERVRSALDAADGVWFFTPEYNRFFSGVLKNFTDWVSRPRPDGKMPPLSGKPVTVSGASTGMSGTLVAQSHFVTLLCLLNAKVMNAHRVAIPEIMNQTDESGKLTLEESKPHLEGQVEAFIHFIESE